MNLNEDSSLELCKVEGPGEKKKLQPTMIQYIKRGDQYFPAGEVKLVEKLDGFAYKILLTQQGIIFEKTESITDELYLFENSKMYDVIKEIDKFWTLKDNFSKLGYLHNPGTLLYGPPGTGKSSLLQQVSENMAKQDGIIFFVRDIGSIIEGLSAFRQIEPNRRVVIAFEDVDEIARYNEHQLLQLLDGEKSFDNVLYLGTTNYLENFPPRLLRPGRFDKKIKIDYPPFEGRLVYLQKKLNNIEEDAMIRSYAERTDGFSFGHLREFVIAAFAFKEDVDETICRLKDVGYSELPKRDTGEVKQCFESIIKKQTLTESMLKVSKEPAMQTKDLIEQAIEKVMQENGQAIDDTETTEQPPTTTSTPVRRYAKYGWIITKDVLEGQDVEIIGPSRISPEFEAQLKAGEGEEFELYDDDMALYYVGRIVGDYDGFEPQDDYGEPNAGTAVVKLAGEIL